MACIRQKDTHYPPWRTVDGMCNIYLSIGDSRVTPSLLVFLSRRSLLKKGVSGLREVLMKIPCNIPIDI
jgi:hypothetical protein